MTDDFLNTRHHRYMRQGLMRGLQALQDYIEYIEFVERNASRRYKLLKASIDWCLDNTNYVVDAGAIKAFKYEFDKGNLKIVDDTSGDVRFDFWAKRDSNE